MKHRIRVIHGDITRLQVGAIVNAANNSLLGGGGVDGAIHRAAGPELLAACREIVARHGECQTGQAVITSAGKWSAQAVIHTVGPVWQGGGQGEAALLASAWRHSLLLAEEHLISTIAFPSISTGVYGYPKAQAAETTFATVSEFLSLHDQPHQVYFVCFDEQTFTLYQKLLAQWQQ
ncbi:O-acetyl-ADP-ribose deacetylase [Erwiniaceae bacterium BAC15a-03b]|uniref:O-acetyl-ADP-ribose deacetylase n=1 Tax=Winslowiella arboricola TaxID=2978220 RepID=A0A9J6PXN1_9GAMM|nr:O-acetyl-ADP-ribose deacetylase [Winslowiella arboricola]MCU5775371.1 O-acetyl-ADP-ribose deacetylase [Winslowiella arboricola]MCU5780232.1 O-acetyl-ADP-ribose deacetylase [Winslowiella arboricola]